MIRAESGGEPAQSKPTKPRHVSVLRVANRTVLRCGASETTVSMKNADLQLNANPCHLFHDEAQRVSLGLRGLAISALAAVLCWWPGQ